MLTNLTLQCRAFPYEITALTHNELEFAFCLIQARLNQCEPTRSGALNRGEIRVVRLGIGITWLPKLFRGERVNDACLKPGSSKRALYGLVILTGALDRNDQVCDRVLSQGNSDLVDGGLKRQVIVLDFGWRDVYVSIEVGEHPLGSSFGTIDRDNSKMFGTYSLNSGMNDPMRLLQDIDLL
jgi:hypothetical protein